MKPEMLAYFRKKRGIEQARLAEKLDVHVITVSRWERGISEPRASEIAKLCEVLGVSEAELLRGPAEEKWVLEIKIADSKEEVIDMTGTMPCVAAITGTQNGANLQLSAKWETFRDDAKYQDFPDPVPRARGLRLALGAGMDKRPGAGA